MNKTSILKIISFFLFLILLDRGIGKLLSTLTIESKYDKRLGLLLENRLSSDGYIVGSSRAARNIDPLSFSINSGYETYNLGRPGSNISFHRLLIELVLRLDVKPDFIILTLGDKSLLDNDRKDAGGVSYPEDLVQSYVDNNLILNELSDKGLKNLYLSKLSNAYRQNNNLNSSISKILNGNEKESRINRMDTLGSMLLPGQSVTYDTLTYMSKATLYDKSIEDKDLVNDLNWIIEKTSDLDVDLIIVFTPEYRAPTSGFYNRIRELDERLVVLDLREEYRAKDDFYDKVHLNEIGSKYFTVKLLDKLNSYFEKKDN